MREGTRARDRRLSTDARVKTRRRPTRPTRAALPRASAVVVVWPRDARDVAAARVFKRASVGLDVLAFVCIYVLGFSVYRGWCLIDEVVVMGIAFVCARWSRGLE